MTTGPHLVLDLMKAVTWREELHKRDAKGRFTSVRSGSKVVTKAGKTGVVRKVTDTHYLVDYDDGKKSKVLKGNVVHANDISKTKKAAKKKPAAKKAEPKKKETAKATKPAKKTTSKAKPASKVTKKAETVTSKKKPTAKKAAPKVEKKEPKVHEHGARTKPKAVSKPIGRGTAKTTGTVKDQQEGIRGFKEAEKELPKQSKLDASWNSKAVQSLMKKPVGKRDPEKIAALAGQITEENDKLAHSLTNKRLASLGLPQRKNKIGTAATKNPFTYETGLHGDLLQSARGAMFETLVAVMSGSQKPGSDIGPHVVNRMKDKMTNDLYGVLNAIPAPHEIRPALRALKSGEQELSQKLGRAPSDKELGEHMASTSKHFNDAPVIEPPSYDTDKEKWVDKKQRVTDPEARVALLRQYDALQRVASTNVNVGDDGEREVTLQDGVADTHSESPEERYERKERQGELKGALPKAMESMGMDNAMIKVWTLTHSGASGNRSKHTGDEVAEMINAEGGFNGEKVDRRWVSKHYTAGRKIIEEALKNNHPALAQLRMMKSLVLNDMLKSVYEYNLVKSIMSWGFGPEILERKFVRTESGRNIVDIKKSLAPDEYIASIATVDSGYVHARITKNVAPEGEELLKAFHDYDDLAKALFKHKEGGNHAVNQKAAEYVKANKKKYTGMATDQATRIRNKSGKVTWSEQLVLDNPGSAWIHWGGKRILIHSGTGEVLYDSKNEAHRSTHNEGVDEDKLEFQHEADDHEEGSKKLADEAHAAIEEAGGDHSKLKVNGRKASVSKFAKHYGAKTKKVTDESGKEVEVLDMDEDGRLNFDHSGHKFTVDHGLQAFEESIGDLANHIKEHKADAVEAHHHKAIPAYVAMSEDERAAYDAMSADERNAHIGDRILGDERVKALMDEIASKADGKNGAKLQKEYADQLNALGKDKAVNSLALRNSKKMAAAINDIGKAGGSEDAIRQAIGERELSRGREEANKRIVPDGYYEIGNKQTGKSMVVKMGHRIDENKGTYTSYVIEAFDPHSGRHFTTEDTDNSWGQLGKELGLSNNSAESFIYESNKANNDAVMTSMDESEALDLRSHTNLGLRDNMAHKDFKKVDEKRDRDGNVTSTTYAQDMPDGTQNVFEVGADGYIKDPIMARLIGNRDPIKSEDDLHEALANAVGNTTWVTAHAGSDIHIGDALGHHVKLQYDGQGAPRVVGGKYDGYRFMDSADIPKGAIDARTGEPIKALFKNGKLVDRKFTTQNDVPMKRGNSVMYKDGDGWKKGKIASIRDDGSYSIHDSKGNVIGLFDKKDLKPAKASGRTLSQSGNATVRLKEDTAHRISPHEAIEDPKQKKKLASALQKAGIRGAIDRETGELNKELDLSSKDYKKLRKELNRSKAGKEVLKKFRTANLPSQLELHVPENMRTAVEAEGVAVGTDGRANISAGKFEQLRDVLGGLSMDHKAQDFMKDHFKRKDRTPRPVEDLKKDYQPSQAEGVHAEEFRKQFKQDSFLMNPQQGLYGTQLEGVSHLVERGRGIAGHGMGTGKTILGVMAGLHHKATQLAQGKKPGKTLIVAPKGIMSDWGKEIGSHTNSKALYIGSGFKGGSKHPETGRKMWGQAGTEMETMDAKAFKKNMSDVAGEDHDFHIVSYDTFMRNKDHFANSGMYDNIAIDEIHAFKNQGGRRGASLAETTDKFKNVWGLSGTPMENDARELHALIDTVTGGKHELGDRKEFTDRYMMKDRRGRIVGIKPEEQQPKDAKLGDIVANIVQFRGGEDVRYNDGSKIHFPNLAGSAGTPDNPNPQNDFVGNLVDRSRDHATTEYYGTKHSVTDFEKGSKTVTTAGGETYNVDTHKPAGLKPGSPIAKMYDRYNELQQQYLPDSKLNELETATATGFDSGGARGKGDKNYLTAMQKLQKFLNAPNSDKMYVPGGNALDSEATGAQPEKGAAKGDPIPFETDADGHKRYYEADGQGGYKKNADGSPKLLPPLHHDNPKADYLRDRLSSYLDGVQRENADRRRAGKPEIMPKVVVKSSYTTFGTDIADGVIRDLQREHPELQRWAQKTEGFGAGQFTGEATDREQTKTGFRGNKKNYAAEQGNLWATTVSPAGKEGVDFGNAHYMIHFDQDWNPQKMAQFTARVRRSDSAKTHAQVDRANSVRVESLHMPGTVEDFMFDAQDKKMASIKQVTDETRNAEQAPKYGDTQGGVGRSYRGFTRGKRNKAGAKPKGTVRQDVKAPSKRSTVVGRRPAEGEAADKSFKLVVLL